MDLELPFFREKFVGGQLQGLLPQRSVVSCYATRKHILHTNSNKKVFRNLSPKGVINATVHFDYRQSHSNISYFM
jgi:hypothetical protein